MPDPGGAGPETRVHAKEQDFILNVRQRGHFTVLAPEGRYTDTLLGVLVQDFLGKPSFLAVDLSKLNAVTLPLIRALCEYAAELPEKKGRLVLLRPPDKIRNLVRLVAKNAAALPIVLSEEDLQGDPGDVQERMHQAAGQLEQIRRLLQTDPSWQFVDADCRWLCPFCATLRSDIRLVSHSAPTPAVIDRVRRHLREECSTYSEGAAEGWPRDVLERALSHANAELARQSSDHPAGRSSSRIIRLEEKKKMAEEVRKDASIAGERRRRLLPSAAPGIPRCDAEIFYLPSDLMGGAFYNFVPLAEGKVGIVLGDVSVHDLDAGVLMGMARKVISMRLRESGDPLKALIRANDDLFEDLDRQSYVTAVVAVVDGARREAAVSTAGHVLPFLVRTGPPPEILRLEPAGPALGLAQGGAFDQGLETLRLPLRSSDVLLFHNGGLEHLKTDEGQEFGADRVAAVLKTHANVEASLILGALALEVNTFAGNAVRQADIAAICVKVH